MAGSLDASLHTSPGSLLLGLRVYLLPHSSCEILNMVRARCAYPATICSMPPERYPMSHSQVALVPVCHARSTNTLGVVGPTNTPGVVGPPPAPLVAGASDPSQIALEVAMGASDSGRQAQFSLVWHDGVEAACCPWRPVGRTCRVRADCRPLRHSASPRPDSGGALSSCRGMSQLPPPAGITVRLPDLVIVCHSLS